MRKSAMWVLWAGLMAGSLRAAAPALPNEPAKAVTKTVLLDQLAGWDLPETKCLKFEGELPVKSADGSAVKAKPAADGIYFTSATIGLKIYKPGEKWGLDTKYPDGVTGHYTFLVEKSGDTMGVRSYVAQSGSFQGKAFVLLDINGNGRFDDLGTDVLVWEKTTRLPLGEPVPIGEDKYQAQVASSGTSVTFTKALGFSTAGGAGNGDGGAEDALGTWNAIRASLGLLPVKRDSKIEEWGYKHIEYMKAVGHLTHPEDKGNPKYTEEGHKAGMASDLSQGPPTAKQALLGLLDSFFHRIPLIAPELETTGISHDTESHFSVFNHASGPRRKDAKWPGPLAYPPDGAMDVQPGWNGHEGPQPFPGSPPQGGVGQTITLTFPHGQKCSDGSLTVKDASGAAVDGWQSTPAKPANGMFKDNMNTLCFIAKQPFKESTAYTIEAKATVGGKPFEKTWRFTTGQMESRYGQPVPERRAKK